MSEPTTGENTAPPPMRAITVSREYGSGGGEIAARLAAQLHWRLVDHEVVVEVARRLGVTETDAAQRDEQPESLVDQVLRSFRAVDPTPLSMLGVPETLSSLEAHDYAIALRETVLAAAKSGQSVIIGRGSQMILRDWRDVLHVRIVAPLEQRVNYVAHREELSQDTALHRIQRKDRDRQRYLRMTHDRQPDDSLLYDIILNTAVLDLDSCVDLIALALERKAHRLGVAASALGASAGLTAYAHEPADLPPLTPPDTTDAAEPAIERAVPASSSATSEKAPPPPATAESGTSTAEQAG